MRSDSLVIAGALVYDGEGGLPTVADVYVADGLIERVAPASDAHSGPR